MGGDWKLRRHVALVTGAAGGIGAAICRALAAEGASVAVHYHRSAAKASSLADELALAGADAAIFQADLRREEEAKNVVTGVMARFGRLDILINNAGWTRVIPPDDLAGLTDELISETFALKVNAPLYMVRAAAPHLKASGQGSIVNITSVAGIAARGSSIAYAAANAALSNLTRSFARILAPEVRVNAVAPGYIETGFTYPADGKVAARVSQHNYLGRCATAAEVAAAVRFLCTDGPSITGEEIVVDGGIGRLGKK